MFRGGWPATSLCSLIRLLHLTRSTWKHAFERPTLRLTSFIPQSSSRVRKLCRRKRTYTWDHSLQNFILQACAVLTKTVLVKPMTCGAPVRSCSKCVTFPKRAYGALNCCVRRSSISRPPPVSRTLLRVGAQPLQLGCETSQTEAIGMAMLRPKFIS